MKEIRDILREAGSLGETGRPMVLATVVHLEGSSYRRPGARMLVSDTGELTGAISGGCLEGDALQKALLVMSQGTPRIVTYDTTDDDDPLGVGLGCKGVVRVLMEPVKTEDPFNPISLLRRATYARRPCVLATLFSVETERGPQPGSRMLVETDGYCTGKPLDEPLALTVNADAQKVMLTGRSAFYRYESATESITAFLEYLAPPFSLVVVGAGNDAVPIAAMAGILGWETTIVDGRPSHADTGRFIDGCRVFVARPEEVLEKVHIDNRTAVVLMTHNYAYDKAVMKALHGRELGYLGMLGPRRKFERMLEELQTEGLTFDPEGLNRMYAPVGLDIGAETPEEIALSILSEVVASLSGHPGMSLRDLGTPIHPREDHLIIQRKLP